MRVVKRPLSLRVAFAPQGGTCDTLEGPVGYRTGDAVLTGVRGEHWPVRRDLFLASYSPEPPTEAGQDGLYRKNPSVALALQLDRDTRVPVGWQPDALHGHPGDWLLRYDDGSHGVLQDAIFRETYEAAPPTTSPASSPGLSGLSVQAPAAIGGPDKPGHDD
jgi:hypothetical protein